MPSPPALRGAGPAEVAQAVRLPGRRVHLAFRRCRQRPSIDRWALDFRQSSFRRVTRVSLRNGCSVCSPFSALSASSCPPRPFELRCAADPRMASASFPSVMGMLHDLLRRTGRWRQSAAGGC